MNAKYLKLFVDCLGRYQKLSDAEFGRLVRTALRYKADGVETSLDGREGLMWDGMKLDIDRDNEAYQSFIEKQSSNASKRWNKNESRIMPPHPTAFLALPTHANPCQTCQDKEEDKDKDIPPLSPDGGSGDVLSPFEIFWKTYPRKVGKDAARKKFHVAIKKTTLETILASVEACKKSDQWQKDGGQFIPHPATWLNRGGWHDELPASSNPSSHSTGVHAETIAALAADYIAACAAGDESAKLSVKQSAASAHIEWQSVADAITRHNQGSMP